MARGKAKKIQAERIAAKIKSNKVDTGKYVPKAAADSLLDDEYHETPICDHDHFRTSDLKRVSTLLSELFVSSFQAAIPALYRGLCQNLQDSMLSEKIKSFIECGFTPNIIQQMAGDKSTRDGIRGQIELACREELGDVVLRLSTEDVFDVLCDLGARHDRNIKVWGPPCACSFTHCAGCLSRLVSGMKSNPPAPLPKVQPPDLTELHAWVESLVWKGFFDEAPWKMGWKTRLTNAFETMADILWAESLTLDPLELIKDTWDALVAKDGIELYYDVVKRELTAAGLSSKGAGLDLTSSSLAKKGESEDGGRGKADGKKSEGGKAYDDMLALKEKAAECRKALAQTIREQGNSSFVQGQYEDAIESYTRAEGYDWLEPIYPLNRAACYLKLKMYTEAERDCSRAIELDPNNHKAYYRRGASRAGLCKINEARQDFEMVLKLQQTNQAARDELQKLDKRAEAGKGKVNADTASAAPAVPLADGLGIDERRSDVRPASPSPEEPPEKAKSTQKEKAPVSLSDATEPPVSNTQGKDTQGSIDKGKARASPPPFPSSTSSQGSGSTTKASRTPIAPVGGVSFPLAESSQALQSTEQFHSEMHETTSAGPPKRRRGSASSSQRTSSPSFEGSPSSDSLDTRPRDAITSSSKRSASRSIASSDGSRCSSGTASVNAAGNSSYSDSTSYSTSSASSSPTSRLRPLADVGSTAVPCVADGGAHEMHPYVSGEPVLTPTADEVLYQCLFAAAFNSIVASKLGKEAAAKVDFPLSPLVVDRLFASCASGEFGCAASDNVAFDFLGLNGGSDGAKSAVAAVVGGGDGNGGGCGDSEANDRLASKTKTQEGGHQVTIGSSSLAAASSQSDGVWDPDCKGDGEDETRKWMVDYMDRLLTVCSNPTFPSLCLIFEQRPPRIPSQPTTNRSKT